MPPMEELRRLWYGLMMLSRAQALEDSARAAVRIASCFFILVPHGVREQALAVAGIAGGGDREKGVGQSVGARAEAPAGADLVLERVVERVDRALDHSPGGGAGERAG